jgi:hypothetical protein
LLNCLIAYADSDEYARNSRDIIGNLITKSYSDPDKKLCNKGTFRLGFRSFNGDLCYHATEKQFESIIAHCSETKDFYKSKCFQRAMSQPEKRKLAVVSKLFESKTTNNYTTIDLPKAYSYSKKNIVAGLKDRHKNKNYYIEKVKIYDDLNLKKHNIDNSKEENAKVSIATYVSSFETIKSLLKKAIGADNIAKVEIYISHAREKNKFVGLIPASNDLGNNHLAIRIGEYAFEWLPDSVVKISKSDLKRSSIVAVFEPENNDGTILSEVIFNEEIINKLATVIHRWNCTTKYHILTNNCQKFGKELLRAMNLKTDLLKYSEGIGDYVKTVSSLKYIDKEISSQDLMNEWNNHNSKKVRDSIENAEQLRLYPPKD